MPWTLSQHEDSLSRYGFFHYKDKTVVTLSYLYNGNPYTGKTIFKLIWPPGSLCCQIIVSHSIHNWVCMGLCLPWVSIVYFISMRKDFNYPHHLNGKKWWKKQIHNCVFVKKIYISRVWHMGTCQHCVYWCPGEKSRGPQYSADLAFIVPTKIHLYLVYLLRTTCEIKVTFLTKNTLLS